MSYLTFEAEYAILRERADRALAAADEICGMALTEEGRQIAWSLRRSALAIIADAEQTRRNAANRKPTR